MQSCAVCIFFVFFEEEDFFLSSVCGFGAEFWVFFCLCADFKSILTKIVCKAV